MWTAALLVAVGALLIAGAVVVVRRSTEPDIAGLKGGLVMTAILGGILLIGGGVLYVIIEAPCNHAEVRWIASGTEFISQRALNSMGDGELFLDETTASTMAQGSSEETNEKAFAQIGSFARNLAPLSDADRERVQEYAARFLRSASCD